MSPVEERHIQIRHYDFSKNSYCIILMVMNDKKRFHNEYEYIEGNKLKLFNSKIKLIINEPLDSFHYFDIK